MSSGRANEDPTNVVKGLLGRSAQPSGRHRIADGRVEDVVVFVPLELVLDRFHGDVEFVTVVLLGIERHREMSADLETFGSRARNESVLCRRLIDDRAIVARGHPAGDAQVLEGEADDLDSPGLVAQDQVSDQRFAGITDRHVVLRKSATKRIDIRVLPELHHREGWEIGVF